jgi:signal transduction histidine kinase
MRDRVKLLGGVFQLVSHPGQGTTITVRVPLYGDKGGDVWPSVFE